MAEITNLKQILASLKPKLQMGEYAFCVVSEEKFRHMNIKALCTFKEKEGISAILDRPSADSNGIHYDTAWRMISLTVHSALEGIGLLAAVSARFAKEGIPLNVVSAYHHDHLFVPSKFADRALGILQEMQEKA